MPSIAAGHVDFQRNTVYTILIVHIDRQFFRGEISMDNKLIVTLAKVIIAAAWADKELSREEINNLKDLLLQFEQAIEPLNRGTNIGLSSRTSALFEMYTESPIGPEERERLVEELQDNVWSEEDRRLVLTALQNMMEADGKITDEEKAVLKDITTKIESVNTGFFGDMGRLVGGAMHRRSKAVSNAPNRERYFEDYLKNKVYYEMRRRLDLGDANLEIPEEELRKLSLLGGLMARVAKVDKIVLEDERDRIRSILKSEWGLSDEAAAFVTEVATSDASADMDYLRMSREYLEITVPAERANLLDILFTVANADGEITSAERHEIHKIADYLLMSSDSVEAAYSKLAD
jgi:uncharacterized tellurite resistance protein B-like protein